MHRHPTGVSDGMGLYIDHCEALERADLSTAAPSAGTACSESRPTQHTVRLRASKAVQQDEQVASLNNLVSTYLLSERRHVRLQFLCGALMESKRGVG